MRTYVALLRAVNLGSHNKVSMAALRELFAALGAEDVATYVQSGNVVFKSPLASPAELTQAIEKSISDQLGLSVTVVLRTKTELAKVVAGNPFETSESEPRKLHVAFLSDAPDRARVGTLDPKRVEPDEFRVVGREVYLRYPNGYGRTKLSNAYLEKQLRVAATTRNWNTVTTLLELANA